MSGLGRRARASVLALLAMFFAACKAEPLSASTAGSTPVDAGAMAPGTPATPGDTTAAVLASLVTPSTLLIVGTNAGAVAGTPTGNVHYFDDTPGTLVAAAATVNMPVCSIEFLTLQTPTMAADAGGTSIDAALAACDSEDLSDMLARLGALKTPAMVVVVGANAAFTARTTNNGYNYFYGADIVSLVHAARKLYVPVCVLDSDLSLPTASGETPGLSIDESLAACDF